MRKKVKALIIGVSCIAGLLGAMPVWAQSSANVQSPQERLARAEQLSKRGKDLQNRFGEKARVLSSGAQFIINLGNRWDELKPRLEKLMYEGTPSQRDLPGSEKSLAPVNGSNPAMDAITNFSGITQSETSVAWWGQNAIVGFNDSGSFLSTMVSPPPSGNFSFNGWSRSANANVGTPAWTDKGILLATTQPGATFTDCFGDPVCRTTRVTDFYQCSLGYDTRPGPNFSTILMFRSTDGGNTFPVVTNAAAADESTNFLDKPWMDVKPGASTAADTIHVVYTNFAVGSTSIDYVRSINGAATWSAPVAIAAVADPSFLQFGQVVVTPGTDKVYVAWEEFAAGGTRTLRLRKSTDGGITFGPPMDIGTVAPSGDGSWFSALDWLQGTFRAGMEFSGFAVNPATGHLYVSYHAGTVTSPDIFAAGGFYRYADVFFRKSTDEGATWSAPVRVNNDPPAGLVDQFQPGMAVTKKGRIFIVFYDRRNSGGQNYNMQLFAARSLNGGTTWTNKSQSGTDVFAPTVAAQNDYFVNPVYMGDYNNPSADKSGADGTKIIAAWGDNTLGNPDIRVAKFP